MKFTEIPFADANAARIYKDYIGRVKSSIKALDAQNQLEILLEINSHIYEAVAQDSQDKPEVLKVLDALDKLGQPEVFLKPLVAQRKLNEAAKSFNPVKIAGALLLNIGNGFSYVVFGLLYLFLFAFLFLAGAKVFSPENTGFFYRPNHVFILGHYRNSDGLSYGQYEQLGHWFIPVMLAAAAVLYILLTLLLKLRITLKNK